MSRGRAMRNRAEFIADMSALLDALQRGIEQSPECAPAFLEAAVLAEVAMCHLVGESVPKH